MKAESWEIVSLSEIVEIFDGPHATPVKRDSGPWYLSISSLVDGRIDLAQSAHISEEDFIAWTRRVEPQPGDVVFSYETRIGEAALIPFGLRCALGRRMGLLRPNKDMVDPMYLTYAYLGPEFQNTIRIHMIHGSTVNRILLTEMGKFPILLPPPAEQRKIAAILSTWDEAITLTERLIAALQERKRGLMQRLLTGEVRFPGFEGEWQEIRLKDAARVNPPRPKGKENILVSFIGMADVSEEARVVHVELRTYHEVSKGFTGFRDNDVLVAKITPCLENGKGALVTNLTNQIGFGSTEFHVLRAVDGKITPSYLFYHTVTHEFRGTGEMNMVGSAGQKRVPTDFVKNYKIRLPSIAEQDRITNVLHDCDDQIDGLMQYIRQLKTQKRGLMQRLLTGEVRVQVD